MTKKITSSLLIVSFFVLNLAFFPLSSHAAALPITAPSAILLDNGSRILYAKTPHLKRAPASTTKLLTSIVALEQMNPDTLVTIPSGMSKIEPSKIYLRAGEKYRVRDLVKATLINSANDAATSLAIIGGKGSSWRFAQMMNRKAASLGCTRTHFVNASGLPASNQYSTAYDMALIIKEAERYPIIVDALKTKTTIIRSTQGRKIGLKNHNKMLWADHREVLGKTGWTRKARHCFVGVIHFSGQRVFVSMLGSKKLWRDLKTLVDYQTGGSGGVSKTRSNHLLWGVSERKKIQAALRNAGYNPGPIDGHIGRATQRAVLSFQKNNGLSPDGVVGSSTWEKLKSYQ